MRVLVTGTSGQLGSYVAEALLADHVVVGLDIRPQPYATLSESSVVADIRAPDQVRPLLKGVDAVVHCAAQVSVEKALQDPISDAQTNVVGTLNMLHESSLSGVRRFIFVSSAAVFGNPKYIPIDENHPTRPMSNYGVSKLAGEKYSLAYSVNSDMEVVCVRPFNVYSPRADPDSPYSGVITKFMARLKAGRPPVIEGDGRQTRDFIHATDVARVIKLVAEKHGLSGKTFNCGCGRSISILDLANTMITISGKDLKPEFAPARVGDIRDSVSNNARLAGVVGFSTKIQLKDGLAELMR